MTQVPEQCGARDPEARVPEPLHYDCEDCKNAIRRSLLRRWWAMYYERREGWRAPVQLELQFGTSGEE